MVYNICSVIISIYIARHFGSCKTGKLRGTRRKGRKVKSSQLNRTGQYKKCLQYDFKLTQVYSNRHSIICMLGVNLTKTYQRAN